MGRGVSSSIYNSASKLHSKKMKKLRKKMLAKVNSAEKITKHFKKITKASLERRQKKITQESEKVENISAPPADVLTTHAEEEAKDVNLDGVVNKDKRQGKPREQKVKNVKNCEAQQTNFNRASPMKLVVLNKDIIGRQKELLIFAGFGPMSDIKCSKLHPDLCKYLMDSFDLDSFSLVFLGRGRIPLRSGRKYLKSIHEGGILRCDLKNFFRENFVTKF